MGSGLLQGLVEGFRGRSDEAFRRNLEQDAARRQGETELYKYLINSRDPEIRALALTGLYESAQPGTRKRGFGGLMGELQTSSVYPSIRALMDQMVPDFSEARPSAVATSRAPSPPTAQAQAGAAALPPDSPVEPGAAPMPPGLLDAGAPRVPEEPEVRSRALGSAAPMAPGTLMQETPPDAPEATGPVLPPEAPTLAGQMRKRGSQVPTAEEIAAFNARLPIETRIGMARQYLDEESAKRAILGILGAPQTTRQFAAPTFAVEDPQSQEPVPVAFDYTSGRFFFTDGTPVPRGARFIRMSGGGSGGALTSTVQDSADARAQLIAMGADPQQIARGTSTGYWRIRQAGDGSIMVQPSEFVPPPAYSGTTEIIGPDNVPVRAPVLRGGGAGAPLGDIPESGLTEATTKAQGLLASVDKQIQSAAVGPGGLRRQVPPAQMDQITKQAAVAAGLPYLTYTELQQAARARPETTPRERKDPTAGMSMADRIRQRALESMRERAQPSAPPARSSGPGPRR